MLDLKKYENKKINMEQYFKFQEILADIKIEEISELLIEKVNNIRNDNIELTDKEKEELSKIDKIKDKEKKKQKLLDLKNQRIIRVGIDVNQQIKNFIISRMYKSQSNIKDLISSYISNEISIDEIDIDTIMKIFNTMWNNGLFRVTLPYLQNKELYTKKK